jgi:putative methyltransferase (TIGR04325 family)
MSTLKAALRSLPPPLVWHAGYLLKRRFSKPEKPPGFEGPFTSWRQAVAQSDTWDAPEITELSLQSALAAKAGKIACEQDGIPLKDPVYSPTVLAFLLLAAAGDGALNIVDFGGGLGSGYFQNARLLRWMSSSVRWNIVERSLFVKLGIEHFQNDALRFYSSLGEAIANSKSDSLIFTGSLQFIEEPFALINEAARSAVRILAFDRTLTWGKGDDGIFLQRPDPERYYRATYACRCFSKHRFIARLAELGFALVEDFTPDPYANFSHSGMIFACQSRADKCASIGRCAGIGCG